MFYKLGFTNLIMKRNREFYDSYVLAAVGRGENPVERAERKGVSGYEVLTSTWKLLSEGRINADEHWDLSLA